MISVWIVYNCNKHYYYHLALLLTPVFVYRISIPLSEASVLSSMKPQLDELRVLLYAVVKEDMDTKIQDFKKFFTGEKFGDVQMHMPLDSLQCFNLMLKNIILWYLNACPRYMVLVIAFCCLRCINKSHLMSLNRIENISLLLSVICRNLSTVFVCDRWTC